MKNKLISSSLLFDDSKNILFSAGASAIVILLFTFGSFSHPNNYIIQINNSHSNQFKVIVDNMGIIFFVIFMAVITLLTFYSNKETKYGYIMTQPISRDSMIITKTLGIIMSYAIPFIFYLIVSTILISLNTAAAQSIKLAAYKYVFTEVYIVFCITTFIVVLLQLMQMLFSNNISALAMPALIVSCVAFEISMITITLSPKIEFVRTFLKFLYYKIFGNYKAPGIVSLFLDYCNANKIVAGIIFLLISAVIFAITILINRKIKYESLSGIFTFKIIKNIFKGIISLLFVLLIESIVSIILVLLFQKIIGLDMDLYLSKLFEQNNFINEVCEYLVLIINITWIPLTMFVYKIITRIEKRRMVA